MQRAQQENDKRFNEWLTNWIKNHSHNPNSQESREYLKKGIEHQSNFIAQQKAVNLNEHQMPCFRHSFRERP